MVEARKHGSLAKELLACLFEHFGWESLIVLDFLQSTKTTLQSQIVCKINIAGAALPDLFTDFVAVTQDLPIL